MSLGVPSDVPRRCEVVTASTRPRVPGWYVLSWSWRSESHALTEKGEESQMAEGRAFLSRSYVGPAGASRLGASAVHAGDARLGRPSGLDWLGSSPLSVDDRDGGNDVVDVAETEPRHGKERLSHPAVSHAFATGTVLGRTGVDIVAGDGYADLTHSSGRRLHLQEEPVSEALLRLF